VTLLAVAVGGRGLVPPDDPVLLADDEALLRGRAAFETLRVYDRRPFRLAEHLVRMRGSAERLGVSWPGGFEELVSEALAGAGEPDAVLRLYLTPGREALGEPVSLALVSTLPGDLEERRARGISLISLLGLRAEAPWLLGGVKSTSYAVNIAAESEARARGADDAVFVRDDGVVLEGPVTNVWWRTGSTLFTPSLELGILAGVTRAAVLDAAPEVDLEVREGEHTLDELFESEEVFTTSSVREVMPVVRVDDHQFVRGSAAASRWRSRRWPRRSRPASATRRSWVRPEPARRRRWPGSSRRSAARRS
jgi:4-amino-4-deoxychorismate lyase